MSVLEALGTVVPGDPIPQSAVRAKAEQVVAPRFPDLLRYLSIFETTGIQFRHFVQPMDWYLAPHGWAERAEVYRDAGLRLLERAANRALSSADLSPQQVDGIVFVSTTGLSTPSLDARLVNRMGFRADVTRVPVWGLGCAGGVAGLSLAADLARAHPDRRYLLLSLEVCSLAFMLDGLDLRGFVAATLFSDGAAAALVRGDQVEGKSLGSLGRSACHEWPNSEDVMGWDVLDQGLGVVFSRKIPEIVASQFGPLVAAYVERERVKLDRYVFHPGGARVLEAYCQALGLSPNHVDSAWAVLRRYGNMSSPSVLFTLQESLHAPLEPGETALLAALGPGFASELALLEGPR